MFNPQQRFLVWAVAALAAIWLVTWGARGYFENRKVTAEKVRAYVAAVEFGRLAGAARAQALKELTDKLNALSLQERQKLRADRLANSWLAQMTDAEKVQFIEATLPTGFKQMITAFEQLPDDKRRKLIDGAMKNLRAAQREDSAPGDTNRPPLSPELEAKVRTIGLNSFYSQSSAQTKAELAPLLEEMQRQMESGRLMHH